MVIACPYRGCRGEYAHKTPHLFEASDIEAIERSAALQAKIAENDRLLEIVEGLPEDARLADVILAIDRRDAKLATKG